MYMATDLLPCPQSIQQEMRKGRGRKHAFFPFKGACQELHTSLPFTSYRPDLRPHLATGHAGECRIYSEHHVAAEGNGAPHRQ
jgi:hypothetical protein